MSFIGDSRKPRGPGILAGQDFGWAGLGIPLDARSCLLVTRVTSRKAYPGESGVYEVEETGDFLGFHHRANAEGRRKIPGWRASPWAGLLRGEPGGSTPGVPGTPTTPGFPIGPGPSTPTSGSKAKAPLSGTSASSTPGGGGGADWNSLKAAGDVNPDSRYPSDPGAVTPPAAGGTTSGATDGTFIPSFGSDWGADEGFEETTLRGVPTVNGARIWPMLPGGFAVALSTGTDASAQQELALAVDPRLIAANRGDGAFGTWVVDISGSQIDHELHAPLQSMMRVVRGIGAGVLGLKGSRANALAWNTYASGRGDAVGGLTWDGLTLGCVSGMNGGPFAKLPPNEKHLLARDQDGNIAAPVHLQTKTFFIDQKKTTFDGPLHFQSVPYSEPTPLPYKGRVHLRYDRKSTYRWGDDDSQLDAGMWRWECEFIFGVTTPEDQPKEKEPRDPPPPDDGPPPPTGGGDPPTGPTTPGGGYDEPVPDDGLPNADNDEPESYYPPGWPLTPRVPGEPGGPGDPGFDPNEPPWWDPGFDPFGPPSLSPQPPSGTGTSRRIVLPQLPVQSSTDSATSVERPVGVTHLEMMLTSVVSRAYWVGEGAVDVLHALKMTPAQIEALNRSAPAVMRTVVAGKQSTTQGVWDKTHEAAESRLPGGSADGIVLHLPPELDLIDAATGFAPAGVALSSPVELYGPGVRVGFGTPSADFSSAGEAVVLYGDGAGGLDVFTATGGTETRRLKVSSAGDLELDNGTDIALGTGSGTKIGTSTSQKLAFYGESPVTQPGTIGDPSGGGVVDVEARAALVSALNALRTLGLIDT